MKAIGGTNIYEIQRNVDRHILQKDILSINYKTELSNGYYFTPCFHFHWDGEKAGLIDKTEYYRDFQDEQNPGTLVIEVSEVYTLDNSDPTLPYSAWPALSRVKTWKHNLLPRS